VVLGIDLSEPMLGVADRRAEASGLSNLTLIQGDVQTHRFADRSDVAISRFGTMFFADQAAALANIRRGLRPGGRLCLATWQPLDANDWLTIPGAALLRYGNLSDAEASERGVFAQSDAGSVATTLHSAGYADPQLQPVTLTLTLGVDPDEAVDYLAGTGPGRAALDAVPDDQRPAALDAVRAALADHAGSDGVLHLRGRRGPGAASPRRSGGAVGGRVPRLAPRRSAGNGGRRDGGITMSIVTPVPDEGLGNTSWLIDLGDRRVAVVDPGRHPGPFLAEAERRGGRVAFSVETHLHADFVSGSRELAAYGPPWSPRRQVAWRGRTSR
jgi:SAM-dependent methyltransferase